MVKRHEKKLGQKTVPAATPTIGIIGGTGGMGSLFARFFKKQGFKVLIAGRKTVLTPEACARQSDLLILSVPIDQTEKIARTLGPFLKPTAALMDFTSLKTLPLKAMKQAFSGEVLGCHPVFGPGVKNFKNQVIVFCPGRGKKNLNWLKTLFQKNGAIVKVTTPEKHDELMATVQGLIHTTSLSLIQSLRESGISASELKSFSSPVYRARVDFAARILAQDPELYLHIAMGNPKTVAVLKRYRQGLDELISAIAKKDHAKFLKSFQLSAKWLGTEKENSLKRTNLFIELLSNLDEK